MFSLVGKTALVTGASRGIGRGIALCLAKAGAAAVFLASDEADYITGVTLYVDGGWLTK